MVRTNQEEVVGVSHEVPLSQLHRAKFRFQNRQAAFFPKFGESSGGIILLASQVPVPVTRSKASIEDDT